VAVGLFRDGSEIAHIHCPLDGGAALTAKERSIGGITFEEYVDLAELFSRIPEPEGQP
jgi:hypothetical protein